MADLAHRSDLTGMKHLLTEGDCVMLAYSFPASVLSMTPAGKAKIRLYLDSGPMEVWTLRDHLVHDKE